MGKNVGKRTNEAIFIDLDGVIVYHNYDPENVPDVFIQKTLDFLKECQKKGIEIYLLTARSRLHCSEVLFQLEYVHGIILNNHLFDLPAGRRILINDYILGQECKAKSINLKRDDGINGYLC